MFSSYQSDSVRPNQAVSLTAGFVAALLGAVALAGWSFDINALKCIVPTSLPLKPNIAVGFLLCGVGPRTEKMKADIPIIASTGQDNQVGMAELQSLGVKNFLTKPYNTEKLLATVKTAMETQPAL